MLQAAWTSFLIAFKNDFRITTRNEIHSNITHFIRNYAINKVVIDCNN